MFFFSPHRPYSHVPAFPSLPSTPLLLARRLIRPTSAPWSPTALVLLVALWLATVGNLPLWRALAALPEVQGPAGIGFAVGFAVLIGGVLAAVLALLSWPATFKPAATVLLLAAAAASHFMQAYSAVIDPSMMLNVLHTDAREVRDLLSAALLWSLGWQALLPAAWLWRQPIAWSSQAHPWRQGARRMLRNLGTATAALAVGAAAVLLVFQDFASVMRNHKQLRYLVNPLNSLYALGHLAFAAPPQALQPLQPVGEDARLGASYTPEAKPLLLVLVVGETARAANFPMNGYARDTTPHLSALYRAGELLWLPTVWSCGTNTQASLPCMFSHLGKAAFEASPQRHENLLDVLQRAGLAVAWVDNQSGCKGVCDRVPNLNTRALTDPELCPDGECFDGILARQLPLQLQQLPQEARRRGSLIVLHQMGNHGPAYFKRSPAAFKAYQPECQHNSLQQCSREEVVNAYDNALRYTDQVLADILAWLRTQDADTALLYLSDHGESLGENNLYLHGLPYAIAPETQKRVPWAMWLSPGLRQRLQLDAACLQAQSAHSWSHDNLFHTVLGLSDVRTRAYSAERDILRRCRRSPQKE